jgi:glutaredoxin 3
MFCNQAKEYLSQKGIQFQEKDIMQDPAALDELKKLGYLTTPLIVIDGVVVVGFDTAKIDAALSVASSST